MLKSFRIGGVHPPENKLSAGRKIESLALPQQVTIPLSQHIGAPATPVVAKGDRVKVGTLIGQGNGFVSANIHSSVSGVVLKIEDHIDASGYKRSAVIIQVEEDIWEETIDRSEELKRECNLSSQEILEKITAAGVVGLGGATFPTPVKLTLPQGSKANVLIINAVECEPYLTSDHQLMLEQPEAILTGVTIAMKAVGVEKAIIGIENNKKDAIELLSRLAENYTGITVCALKVKYPQGGEKQLIDAVLNKQIKSGALPLSTGAIVLNVGSAYAVYEAVQKNKPLISRVVTVTGKSIATPSNYRVRIGTPIRQAIEAAGGYPDNTGKLISGGPMMGKTLVSTDVPVTKGCSGVLLIAETEAKRQSVTNCIRCAKCAFACPMGLTPSLLMQLSEFEEWSDAENEHIMDCMECGCCSYTCPSHRPILDYVRMGKSRVGALIRSRK